MEDIRKGRTLQSMVLDIADGTRTLREIAEETGARPETISALARRYGITHLVKPAHRGPNQSYHARMRSLLSRVHNAMTQCGSTECAVDNWSQVLADVGKELTLHEPLAQEKDLT